MRRTTSDADTILDLLEKCQRNLNGIYLRTEDGNVSYSKDDMKQVTKLKESIADMLDGLDELLTLHHEIVKKKAFSKPKKQPSALQEYLRKNK